MNKKLSKIFSISVYVLLAVVFVFFITILILSFKAKKNGEPVSVFGISFFVVVTGSMEPTIAVGDVIINKDVAPETLVVGDVITFKDDKLGKLVTHRIIEIREGGFVTKGDANPVSDTTLVKYDKILGKVTKKTVVFSFLYTLVTSKSGFFILIIIPLLGFLAYESYDLTKKLRKTREGVSVSEGKKAEVIAEIELLKNQLKNLDEVKPSIEKKQGKESRKKQ